MLGVSSNQYQIASLLFGRNVVILLLNFSRFNHIPRFSTLRSVLRARAHGRTISVSLPVRYIQFPALSLL